MKFYLECDMPDRWVPHFLGMLKYMEDLGSMGSSRNVGFMADGDGDFKPKFNWDTPLFDQKLPEPAPPRSTHNGDAHFDAG